jgi:hypothetical protein
VTPMPIKTKASTPFDKPLGPTLDGLLLLHKKKASWDQELLQLVVDGNEIATYCREEYSVELLGRSHDGLAYFGVPLESAAPTVDQRPIVLVDNKGIDPEVVSRNLAEFLSMLAYSPATWGDSKAAWKKCAAESLASYPEDVPRLRELLSEIPGVVVPDEPWKLQARLPTVAFRALPGTEASARASNEALTDRIKKIFTTEMRGLDLLLVFDEVTYDDEVTRVCLILDAPIEVRSTLAAHPVVRGPLAAFLAHVRRELPERKFKIALSLESLSDADAEEVDPWRSLRIALKVAGKPELYFELAKARKK